MPNVSPEMLARLITIGRQPILDSVFIPVNSTESAEKVVADDGVEYISSPIDNWRLHRVRRTRRPVVPLTVGLHAVDVSNYTGALSEHSLMMWQLQHDVGRVIVQSVKPPPGYPPTVTRQQIEMCALAGMPTDVYLYLWTRGDQRADMTAKLALLDGLEQHVDRLWLDVEDTAAATVLARLTSIRTALSVLDAWSQIHDKPRPGIYAARWHWTAYMGDAPRFGDRLLWAADYDGVDDPDVFRTFGSWTSCAIKQYQGTSVLAGVGGVDLNIMRKGA